jgi:hypothetical protein
VTENIPLYDPAGLANGFPTVNVPPILTCVRAGEIAVAIKGEAGLELPICKDNVPPLLPVSITSDPFNI